MSRENPSVLVVSSGSSLSFGTLSWITWIVFMILYYGTGDIAHWPVFWIWFPFWLPFAVAGVLFAFGIIITFLAILIAND